MIICLYILFSYQVVTLVMLLCIYCVYLYVYLYDFKKESSSATTNCLYFLTAHWFDPVCWFVWLFRWRKRLTISPPICLNEEFFCSHFSKQCNIFFLIVIVIIIVKMLIMLSGRLLWLLLDSIERKLRPFCGMHNVQFGYSRLHSCKQAQEGLSLLLQRWAVYREKKSWQDLYDWTGPVQNLYILNSGPQPPPLLLSWQVELK